VERDVPKSEAESVTAAQRWAELLVVAAMLLLFSIFKYHQVANTGFFSTKFGLLEMCCLYGPILVLWIAPLLGDTSGQRNQARPFDAAANLSPAIGSLWLLIVFPFNFAHLADFLPQTLLFATSWITNGIGKMLLMMQIIICPVVALVTRVK